MRILALATLIAMVPFVAMAQEASAPVTKEQATLEVQLGAAEFQLGQAHLKLATMLEAEAKAKAPQAASHDTIRNVGK